MDIKHFYMEKGHGDDLILLHGNGENGGYFQGQIDVFSEQYHVYAIDTRGHGKTPRGDKPFTIRQFSDDLLSFMDEHQIRQGASAWVFRWWEYRHDICRSASGPG